MVTMKMKKGDGYVGRSSDDMGRAELNKSICGYSESITARWFGGGPPAGTVE